ncbi:MAG: VWA domain-containing protein [Clostridiales bacterium]|nr:VWA domain-containing protein [Clostridiales bacterium]
MSLLAPLGFLGLLGLAVLILIYLLKPNYQQKLVSSTFVWKLSLKYKRKKVPINKIRNLLILLCQILIIALCAFIMTGPVVSSEVNVSTEKVIIIDASASMLAKNKDKTRFERAVGQAKELSDEFLTKEDSVISIILAGSKSEVLIQRATALQADEINEIFDDLLSVDDSNVLEHCTFGKGDVSGAVSAAEDIVYDNDGAEIVLFTGTTYIEKSGVTVVDVSEVGEWNAAILDCKAEQIDGYFVFEVEVASYGADRELTVTGIVHGANRIKEGDDYVTREIVLTAQRETFTGDKSKILTFTTADEVEPIYSFEDAYFSLNGSDDSFAYDNYFYLFNGNAESRSIKVQYCSSRPNSFIPLALAAVRLTLWNRRDISITQIRGKTPEIEGYDLYIFEHTMPQEMPTDGIVILINPDRVPRGLDVRMDFSRPVTGSFYLAPGDEHPITKFLNLEEIYVSKYTRVLDYDESFQPILYGGSDPVMLAKNEPDSKVVIMSFSLNFSSLPANVHLSTMFRNIFDYYLPITVTGQNSSTILSSNNVFEVNEEIRLRTRGLQLALTGGGLDLKYNLLAGESEIVKISRSGTYTVTQETISGLIISDNFFVQIPKSESYITKEADLLVSRVEKNIKEVSNLDLIVYFAAVMILLLAAEWWLHSRELRV